VTSRRSFLGLLAAPVAASVAVKEFAGQMHATGGISSNWSSSEVLAKMARYNRFNGAILFKDWSEMEPGVWAIGNPKLSAPNRLFGVEINDDGDAV